MTTTSPRERTGLTAASSAVTRGLRITAGHLSLRAGGQQILRDVSLSAAPGELVAIVGVSGAGKTMLLETIAGWRRPADGVVRWDGRDVHASLNSLRPALGYVPQDDIIHGELTLRRTLRHAARLRLPAGSSRAAISSRVSAVLDALGVSDRAGIAVASLSGGERKRASIGVELLAAPRLFCLDEPTSGLDPATATGFMELLRTIAQAGTTVILTTHSVADLDPCDKIIFLTGDGRVAFTGSAEQAREHFDTTRLEKVYPLLTEGDLVSAQPTDLGEAAEAGESADQGTAVPGRPGAVRQWAVLTSRAAEIQLRNKLTLAILLGSPAMIVAMFAVLFRPGSFAFGHPSPDVTQMTAFWIAFAGFFFGLSYGLPQICAEFGVLRREHHAGVGIGPCLLSKLAVLAPLLALVDLVTLAVLTWLGRLPGMPASQAGGLFVTLLLTSLAALAIGLLTSAAVSGPAQAIVAMPMLCFPQVLFSGGFLPVAAMPAAGRVISYAMSNRWAFEALGHGLRLPRLWANGGSPLGPPLLASYGSTFSHPAWADWAVLGGFTVVVLTAAWIVLGVRCRRYQ